MTTQTDRIAAFHRLHETGCFVIPNPWDVGSARYLAMLGFKQYLEAFPERGRHSSNRCK
jgi:2-methylisocitrate lyase-like PEP mutase family enzyme